MPRIWVILALVLSLSSAASTQDSRKPDPARIDALIEAAFPTATADWQPRLVADETLKLCSTYPDRPPPPTLEKIANSEKAKIEYPADGQLLGDWSAGEKIAQSGYGLRFTDYPARQPNGGNCYACHQLTKQEVSFGTIGPSLLQYGRLRNFAASESKAAYERIYDAQAALPCSNMPRFGVNKVLTIEQIKHVVALLISPESPVNK